MLFSEKLHLHGSMPLVMQHDHLPNLSHMVQHGIESGSSLSF